MEYVQIRKTILGVINNNIGIILKAKGKLDEAIAVYIESLEIRREIEDQMGSIAYQTMINFKSIFVIYHEQIYRILLILSPINYQTIKLNYHENKTNYPFKIFSEKTVGNKKSDEQAVSSCIFADLHLNTSYRNYQFLCKLR